MYCVTYHDNGVVSNFGLGGSQNFLLFFFPVPRRYSCSCWVFCVSQDALEKPERFQLCFSLTSHCMKEAAPLQKVASFLDLLVWKPFLGFRALQQESLASDAGRQQNCWGQLSWRQTHHFCFLPSPCPCRAKLQEGSTLFPVESLCLSLRLSGLSQSFPPAQLAAMRISNNL